MSQMQLCEQIYGIIFYEQNGNVSAAECHRKLCDCLAFNVISLCTIEEWYHKFKNRDLMLDDSSHCGRHIVVNNNDLHHTFQDDNSITS